MMWSERLQLELEAGKESREQGPVCIFGSLDLGYTVWHPRNIEIVLETGNSEDKTKVCKLRVVTP